jgi:hypothetical protein
MRIEESRRSGRIEASIVLLVLAILAITIETVIIVSRAQSTGVWDRRAIVIVVLGGLYALALAGMIRLGRK